MNDAARPVPGRQFVAVVRVLEPDHAVRKFDSGVCGAQCNSGFHDCGGQCVPDGDVATCGQRCTTCPAGPANSVPACVTGACDFTCPAPYARCAAGCWGANAAGQLGAASYVPVEVVRQPTLTATLPYASRLVSASIASTSCSSVKRFS